MRMGGRIDAPLGARLVALGIRKGDGELSSAFRRQGIPTESLHALIVGCCQIKGGGCPIP